MLSNTNTLLESSVIHRGTEEMLDSELNIGKKTTHKLIFNNPRSSILPLSVPDPKNLFLFHMLSNRFEIRLVIIPQTIPLTNIVE